MRLCVGTRVPVFHEITTRMDKNSLTAGDQRAAAKVAATAFVSNNNISRFVSSFEMINQRFMPLGNNIMWKAMVYSQYYVQAEKYFPLTTILCFKLWFTGNIMY